VVESQHKLSRREIWISAALIAALFLAVFAPALDAGLDWTDDHEIIRHSHGEDLHPQIHNVHDRNHLQSAISDFRFGRFRPLYYPVRRVRVSLHGTDPAVWHATQLALGALTCIFFYLGGRKAGLGILAAGLFVGWLAFQAGATEIWFRMGPSETYAVLLMAMGLAAVTWAAERERSHLRDPLAVLCLVGMAFSKETFVPVIPVMLALWVGLKHFRLGVGFWRAIRLTAIPIAVAGAICGGTLVMAALALQQNTYSASVVSQVRSPLSPVHWYNVLRDPASRFAWYLPAALGLLVTLFDARRGKPWRAAAGAMLLCTAVFLPQLPLLRPIWTGSRYFYPAIIGLAGLCAVGLQQLGSIRYLRPAIGILCVVAAVPAALETYASAHRFTARTKTFNRMLDRAVAETGPGESIVIYADPIRWMEQTFSTVIALGNRRSTSPVFLHPYIGKRSVDQIGNVLVNYHFAHWVDPSALSPELLEKFGDRLNQEGNVFDPEKVGAMVIWQNEDEFLQNPPVWAPDPENRLERIVEPTYSVDWLRLKPGYPQTKLDWFPARQ
jgi:hypothetical protein